MNNKIKALLSLKGLNMTRYAEHMGMSKSSLGNKAKRGTWNSDDLIKLAELTNTRLVFIDNDTNKELITFDENDIKKEPTNQ